MRRPVMAGGWWNGTPALVLVRVRRPEPTSRGFACISVPLWPGTTTIGGRGEGSDARSRRGVAAKLDGDNEAREPRVEYLEVQWGSGEMENCSGALGIRNGHCLISIGRIRRLNVHVEAIDPDGRNDAANPITAFGSDCFACSGVILYLYTTTASDLIELPSIGDVRLADEA
jgi:hypothetical protein